ncbi:helix-turn-helix domain-containing protein [Peribacillus sp. YIM B13477]|uniref:helix-turn-helix domain-containing protein n=2 Tax=Bacillaceae TaxID=186817 RepID=UPI003670C609
MTNKQIKDFSYLDKIVEKATGQRIKFLVQRAGFSQSQLAKIMGREGKTISNYYCGKSFPDKLDLITLSRILGVPYDELLIFRGDVECYQRLDNYIIGYRGHEDETIFDEIERSKTESKLFDPDTKGLANIRNLEEAGYCLQYRLPEIQQDIRNRIMDELFSGRGIHSQYMQHIFEFYIWRKLTDEQKAESEKQFAIWRGEKKSEDTN